MRFLLFQIYAPLVSWGEIAVGGERQSSRHPSKSAIIGLLAAALGIKRNEEERLNVLANSLGVAVKLYSAGTVLKDFHTALVPPHTKKDKYLHTRKVELECLALKERESNKLINATLSRREYRCDALSVVAVYLNQDNSELSIEIIEKALRQPVFHLYFGRKSCVPSLPLAPKVVVSSNLKSAFSEYNVDFPTPLAENAPDWLQKVFSNYPQETVIAVDDGISYFWEDGIESGLTPLQSVERYDQPLSRKRWQFTFRREYMAIEKGEEAVNVHQ